MMEKRVILAIALSVLVFFLFQYYQQKYMPEQRGIQPATQAPNREKAEPAQPDTTKTAEVTTHSAPVLSAVDDTKTTAQSIEVAGSLYKAVIDNQGAVLTSWQLNDYKSSQNKIFEMIAGKREYKRDKDGKEKKDKDCTFPASLVFPKDEESEDLANNQLYQVSVEGGSGDGPYAPPVNVVMKLKRGDLKIEKRFSFKKDNYLVDLSMICEKGGKALDGQFILGEDLGPEQEHFISSAKIESIYYSEGKTNRPSPPKDEKDPIGNGNVRWIGLDMQYFSIIAIPDHVLPYFNIQKKSLKTHGLDGKEVNRDLFKTMIPMNGSLQYQLYLGPKKQSNLKAVPSADLSDVINYGFFKILVTPLLVSLRWIYQYVHNYGLAIIILTFLLSLLLFPLRLKQMGSMKKMQVVQPKIKAIQEKYKRYGKADPKKAEMQQEIMALYKEHGVNPLGGCIPMLPQLPLLWAFYSLLGYSIELRHAPFIGWIHDLSAMDPYYVLPIVMGITMFISQKMTPMAPGTDPTQAKMMMVMPLVLTFFFKELSSGLNLYFLCSNIFQIAFQKIAERWMGGGRSGSKAKS
jgi:YidC/Oxa1 family membrane protein insertase